MLRSTIAALLLCSLLAACGGAPETEDGADANAEMATLDSFPVTLEGHLILDVNEGDNEFGEYADANFGDLSVDGKNYTVYATGPVAQAGAIPYEGGKARVTISGMSEFEGSYNITRIEKL